MRITKLGHSCLVIEINNLRILTDPGMWTVEEHARVWDIDVILITHNNPDHLHLESLKTIIKNNPGVVIYANSDVGHVLAGAGIKSELFEGRGRVEYKGVKLEAFDCRHEDIYPTMPMAQNTGYFIAGKLFYPGDSLTTPEEPVEILALPIAGPFMTLAQAIDYALKVKPSQCFPMHDGMLKSPGIYHALPKQVLESQGIKFLPLESGQAVDFD